jgi:polysaccharide pyruvyl transferase WcaK-like protein
MKNKFLFAGYFGNNNLGDELLLQNIIAQLSAHKNNITVYFLSNSVPSIQLPKGVKFDIIPRKSFFLVIYRLFKSQKLIFTGGQLFSNTNIYYYTTIIFLANLFNTEVIIFPIGISNIYKKNWLLRKFWSKVKYLSVRDYTSYKNIDWYSKVEIKPDATFLPQPKKLALTNKVKSIGLNPRNINKSTNKIIVAYFLKLAAKFGNNPVFYIYSTSIGQKNNQDDYDICLTLQRMLNESGFKTEYVSFKNVEEFIKFQSKLDFNFACRLHAFLESLTLGIPSFILKIDEIPKINSIIEFLKFEDLMLDINMKPNLISVISTNFDEINKRVLSHHNDITTTFEKLIIHA